MARLRIAALSLGSLALLGGSPARGVDGPEGEYVTDSVEKWFNLLRNGRIDYPLPELKAVTPEEGEVANAFIQDILKVGEVEMSSGPGVEKKNCTVTTPEDTKGLVLQLTETGDLKYAKALDKALETALSDLITETPTPEENNYGEIKANSISFLASRDTTGFTCAETNNCETAYLVCKFQGPAKFRWFENEVFGLPGLATLHGVSRVLSKEFVQAAEARRKAGVHVEALKPEDAGKPLTPPPSPENGVSKSAVSASVLAALAASVAAVIA